MVAAFTQPRITLYPHTRDLRVSIGGSALTDTIRDIELRELDYPLQQYIPRDALRMGLMTASGSKTLPLEG
ncbi:DUF427 domain-containing protein [Halomonas sp. MG34]|nr:DUF427 domain-containing protein [Halomonas sp. MG34]